MRLDRKLLQTLLKINPKAPKARPGQWKEHWGGWDIRSEKCLQELFSLHCSQSGLFLALLQQISGRAGKMPFCNRDGSVMKCCVGFKTWCEKSNLSTCHNFRVSFFFFSLLQLDAENYIFAEKDIQTK